MQTLQAKVEEAKDKLKAVIEMSNNRDAIKLLALSVGYAELAIKTINDQL